MEPLYYLHPVMTLMLSAWPLWFATRTLQLRWFNPFSLSWLVGLPVQLMKLIAGPAVLLTEGLADKGYQFALLMTDLSFFAQLLGVTVFYRLAEYWRLDRFVANRELPLAGSDFARVKWFFVAIFWLSLLLLASAEFGIVNWLLNPRDGYQHYRTGQGHWYALAVNCLAAAYVMAVLQNPRPGRVMLTTTLYLGLSYLLGSKGTMLSLFVAGLIVLWFLRWKHLGKVTVIGMPLLFALLITNLLLALGDSFELQSVLEYFDYYKNAADYYTAHLSGELPLMWGEVMVSSLWAYVPRALVPDKPSVYGILLVNEFFYPGQAELTNTPAFGGAVEQYADFGLLGVIVFNALSSQTLSMAFLSYLTFRRPGLSLTRMSVGMTAVVLVQYAPAFGSFLPSLLYLSFLGLVLGSLALSGQLKASPKAAQP